MEEQRFVEQMCELFMVLNNDVDYGLKLDDIVKRMHELIHKWERERGNTDTE